MSLLQRIEDAMGEMECDLAIPPITDKEELLVRIAECVEAKDSRSLQAYILEQHLPDADQFWELTTLMAPCLTKENLEDSPRFFTTVRRCLTHFSGQGKPKEMILAFLEQLEGFQEDVKYVTLLPCLQNILLHKLERQRTRSLELAMDTLGCHIQAIPAPQNWNLEGEEIKLLETDENIRRFLDVVPAFLDFMKPFLMCKENNLTKGNRQWECRVLRKHLLQLMNHPLAFLDLRFNSKDGTPKTYSRELAETAIEVLSQVQPDFYRLLIVNPADGKVVFTNLEREDEDNEAEDREDVVVESTEKAAGGTNMEAENSENERRESGTGDRDENKRPDEFSELAGGCLAYLAQVEHLGEQAWPVIHTPIHLLHATLGYTLVLLTNPAYTAVYKGIALLSFYLDVVYDYNLPLDTLDDDKVMPVVKALITVMRFCPIRELRIFGLTVFKTFFVKLDCPARYQLMKSVLASCEHAGVKAVVVGLIKSDIDKAFKVVQAQGSEGDGAKAVVSHPHSPQLSKSDVDKAAENDVLLKDYFLGVNLQQLLCLATSLPSGATTDLLEESDLIMAALNLLRFLVLRDSRQADVTGIWRMLPSLEKEYFSALRMGLNMSVGHYQLELDNVSKGPAKRSDDDIMSSVSVAGTELPTMSRSQQMNVIQSALTTFDMMKCVLARLSELIDQKPKS